MLRCSNKNPPHHAPTLPAPMTGPLNTVKIIVMSVIVYTYITHSINQRIEQRYEKASLPSITFLALALLTVIYFLDNLIMTSRLYKQHFHLLQIWLAILN